MPVTEIITKSAEDTKKVGFDLVKKLKKQPIDSKHALIIALEGNLGSGKTTFIQGLAKGLKIKENVLSPTFLILKQFLIPIKQSKFTNFYHIDAYRMKNYNEILELGFKDLIKNPGNLILIEWAEKIKKTLPRGIIKIKFVNLGKNKRKIIIYYLLSKRVMSPSGHGLRSKSEGESLSERAGRARKA